MKVIQRSTQSSHSCSKRSDRNDHSNSERFVRSNKECIKPIDTQFTFTTPSAGIFDLTFDLTFN